MATTINNISLLGQELLADAIENGELEATDTPNVFSYQVGNETVLVSDEDIDMASGNDLAGMLVDELAREAGDGSGTVSEIIGNDLNNFIVGNSSANQLDGGLGDDQIATGAGDDVVNGGEGDDTMVLGFQGTGIKDLTGGEGNDTFIIKASGEDSLTTITDFNSGDTLRWYADANEDGQINIEDLNLDKTIEIDGDTILTLVDGTTVCLEGVTGIFGGEFAFEFGIGDDDEPFVDITFVDM